jgi:hypothetical protein
MMQNRETPPASVCCLHNPNPPHAPRTSPSTRESAISSEICRVSPAGSISQCKDYCRPSQDTILPGKAEHGGGDGGASGVASSSRNLPPPRHRYRTGSYRFRERPSLMSEALTPGELLAGGQWRRQNGAEGGISGVSNAGHCRAVMVGLIRDPRISSRGVPPRHPGAKKITAPRGDTRLGQCLRYTKKK